MFQMFIFIVFLHFSAASFAKDSSDQALNLLRITPSGEDVAAGRQVVFTFDKAVVAIGKMDRKASDIPIDISPQLDCQWRWLNTKSLACQLGDETSLQAATRYVVTIGSGIKTESGIALVEQTKPHIFITKRPRLSYDSFRTWLAPGMPVIGLSFTQKVSRDSVLKHIYFKFNRQRYGIKIAKKDKNKTSYGSYWLIQAKQFLPKNKSLKLRIEAGLKPKVGLELGIENRDITKIHIFPDFKFLGVQCTDNNNETLYFTAKVAKSSAKRCNPLQNVALLFTSPVSKKTLKNLLTISPALGSDLNKFNPWGNDLDEYSYINQKNVKNKAYKVWLPTLLKPYQLYRFSASGKNWKDEFQRTLKQKIDISLYTDHRPPYYQFEHNESVLEQGVDSDLPITVTNLKQLIINYQTQTTSETTKPQHISIDIPQVIDRVQRIPFGIRQLLKGQSGVVAGTFNTVPNVDANSKDEAFITQVSPYHLHAKIGHHNSLVWVTDFATGQPVSGVQVSIYSGYENNLSADINNKAMALTDEDGIAKLPGRKTLDPKLVFETYESTDLKLIIKAQKDKNMAVLPLGYINKQSLYQFTDNYALDSTMQKKFGHIQAWGTTAQGIYRTGETIQFKLWLRDQDNTHFIAAPQKGYKLTVYDAMGSSIHEVTKMNLSKFGAYDGEFTLAKNASIGWYRFEITADFIKNQSLYPMKVLVSDFSPAPFKVSNSISGKYFEAGDKARVETIASLHAGGPYSSAHTRVRVLLQPRLFVPKTKISKGFQFDTLLKDNYDAIIFETEAQSDDKGRYNIDFVLNGKEVVYGQLLVESTVRDERGKDVASRTYAAYNGRDKYIGIRADQWMLNAGTATEIPLLVVNAQGEALANTAITTSIDYRETQAARVKGAGNVYLTRYIQKWVPQSTCQNQSQIDKAVKCTFTPEKSGRYRITASIKDSKGRIHKSSYNQWAAGNNQVLWESGDNNQLDIEAEQAEYKVGDTARYLIKNPFLGAKALITIERYGILKSWVQNLNKSVEILEVPIEADYLPGFYLSVMVFSGRQDQPLDANHIDLGKPSYKMGYVQTTVADPYKTLQIDISSDKEVYKPREQVTLDIKVDSLHKNHEKPVELSIAVLDESVFALLSAGLNYYDPYKGFYSFNGIDVQNYNFLDKLVGRQHFAKKGANPGGDGGSSLALRDLFKFVSYWNPSVITDNAGKAQVKFEVPDNLTGWRVLVMATNQTDYMGLGHHNFKVNKTIELRPILPNQILQGDRFDAGFSVLNRSEKPLTLNLSIKAEQNGVKIGEQQKNIKVAPYKREAFSLNLQTDIAADIILTASAVASNDKDILQVNLLVNKRRVGQVAASYGHFDSVSVTETIRYPDNIYADTGGLKVKLSASILENIDGSFEYMRDYPYSCWEQTLSKGLAAQYYGNLQAWLADDMNWQGHKTLPAEVLSRSSEFQAPNGGMTYFIPTDAHVSPYLSAFTAIGFAWLRDQGQQPPKMVVKKLHTYLKSILKKDKFPNYYNKGMQATTRAITLYALSRYGKTKLGDIQRYIPHLPYMSLFGKALFLQTTLRLSNTERYRTQIFNSILAQSDQSSGELNFNENLDRGYSQMLSSPMRTNCAVLSALIDYDSQIGKKHQDLITGLARSLNAKRKKRNHWSNTQENLFCMQAMMAYARTYESVTPYLQINAKLGDELLGQGKMIGRKADPLIFERPMQTKDIGKTYPLTIERSGEGAVYYKAQLSYAETAENSDSVNAGMELIREYSVKRDNQWQKLVDPMQLHSGELVRVDLYLSLPADRDFVVVDDPVAGGLEPVNRDLATASVLAAKAANNEYAAGATWFKHKNWQTFNGSTWQFYHRELRHHAVRFYADHLRKGNYYLSYIAQAIVTGDYQIMPSHSEQMYSPEVYGNSRPATLQVIPAK